MATEWHGHGNDIHDADMARTWQRSGMDMAMTWQRKGTDMATTWQRSGMDMATTWQEHGHNIQTTAIAKTMRIKFSFRLTFNGHPTDTTSLAHC